MVLGRIDRRQFVLGAISLPAAGSLGGALAGEPPLPAFESLPPSHDDEVRVPPGYRADVVLAWGDPLFPGAPAFDLAAQSAERQGRQFGFNCDFNAFLPLAGADDRGVICVNHEYTRGEEMFPGFDRKKPTEGQVAAELAAHGMTIAELRLDPERSWNLVLDSKLNRRITGSTPMGFDGPVAGTELLRTEADPEGARVLGMLSNCGGGKTPWGTVLTCEEKFSEYFSNAGELGGEASAPLRRYSFAKGDGVFRWARHRERFDAARHPNEPNRFGWVVEVDPFDPDSTPVKHTALGRFAREAATCGLADDGRVVVYSGDDDRFEYLYKFVSEGRFDAARREEHRGLLERGTLHVARFHEDGTGEWLPLVPEGPLADWTLPRILVHARLAADALGATPMDRPEDVELDPYNHRVYACLTNNKKRKQGDGGPNPRAQNRHGHVIELSEHGGDLAATRFDWTLFLLGGVPELDTEETASLSCPDNLTFDSAGNLWLATDGQQGELGNDAVYVVPTAGPRRGRAKRFLTGVRGGEICGPELTPDERTFFVNIQHPGEKGGLEHPTSTWPHDGTGIPRPALVAVRRLDGGPVG